MSRPNPAWIVLGLLALAASAEAFDWGPVADQDVVVVTTTDDDGAPRETKIWLAVIDGQGHIRTGGSTWGANITRTPHAVLRFGGEERPSNVEFDVVFVADDGERERIDAAFREKYGAQDALVGLFRGSNPKIMRLIPAR
jgi:hypothetical protein